MKAAILYKYMYIYIIDIYIWSFVSLHFCVPGEGSLLPKYIGCATPDSFELYLMCFDVMLFLPTIYIYTCLCNVC